MIVTHTAAAHLRFTFKALPNVLPDIIWYSSDHSCYLTTPVLSKVVCGQFNCLGAICSSVSRAEPDFPAKRTSSSRLELEFPVNPSTRSSSSTRFDCGDDRSGFPFDESQGQMTESLADTDSIPRSTCSPSFPRSAATVSGSPKGGPSLTDSCSSKSGLIPLLTMRQGYHLQRPSAVVSRTTASRPRSFGRARDRRSEPAVPLVLRRISGAKAESLIGRVKLTCLTTV